MSPFCCSLWDSAVCAEQHFLLLNQRLDLLCDHAIIQSLQLKRADRMLLLPQVIVVASLWTCESFYPGDISFVQRKAIDRMDSQISPLRRKPHGH